MHLGTLQHLRQSSNARSGKARSCQSARGTSSQGHGARREAFLLLQLGSRVREQRDRHVQTFPASRHVGHRPSPDLRPHQSHPRRLGAPRDPRTARPLNISRSRRFESCRAHRAWTVASESKEESSGITVRTSDQAGTEPPGQEADRGSTEGRSRSEEQAADRAVAFAPSEALRVK